MSDVAAYAGARADVSVILYGSAGEAGPLRLVDAGHTCFQPGTCDVFNLTTPTKLGQLQKLKVGATS